ncbi:MAG: hypothetical protein LBJ47_11285 [Tannerella sp.]|nr:hypothetical protein [Tannerella sp.]
MNTVPDGTRLNWLPEFSTDIPSLTGRVTGVNFTAIPSTDGTGDNTRQIPKPALQAFPHPVILCTRSEAIPAQALRSPLATEE